MLSICRWCPSHRPHGRQAVSGRKAPCRPGSRSWPSAHARPGDAGRGGSGAHRGSGQDRGNPPTRSGRDHSMSRPVRRHDGGARDHHPMHSPPRPQRRAPGRQRYRNARGRKRPSNCRRVARDQSSHYLSFSVASPMSASTIAMIQKRITIVGSAQPFFSKW